MLALIASRVTPAEKVAECDKAAGDVLKVLALIIALGMLVGPPVAIIVGNYRDRKSKSDWHDRGHW
jgi:hypothetical protein